jgi:hypothetical protein
MGTRRPLIVQMVHDPAALQPRCRLQDEGSEEFGAPLPESAIADAIVKRTQDHLRELGGASVSGKPIVMRAEWVRACRRAAALSGGQCKHLWRQGPGSAPAARRLRGNRLIMHPGSKSFALCCAAFSCASCSTPPRSPALHRYAYCANLTIIDTPGFILKVVRGVSDMPPAL